MLLDIGKIIGGPGQGDGPAGVILNFFAPLLALGGGAALMGGEEMGGVAAGAFDLGGMAAERGGAGIFEQGFKWAFSDPFLDYILYRDYGKRRQSAAHQEKDYLKEVITGHGFMRAQLERYGENDAEIAALRDQYRDLKLALPPEDLVKNAFKKLSKYLHPDMHTDEGGKKAAEALFKILGTAKDTLTDQAALPLREAYKAELRHNEPQVRKAFEDCVATFTQVDWKEFYAKASEASASQGPKLAIAGATLGAASGAKAWFSRQSTARQAGLVFAGVAATAIGVYVIAKAVEAHRRKRSAAQLETGGSHAGRVSANANVGRETAYAHSR